MRKVSFFTFAVHYNRVFLITLCALSNDKRMFIVNIKNYFFKTNRVCQHGAVTKTLLEFYDDISIPILENFVLNFTLSNYKF